MRVGIPLIDDRLSSHFGHSQTVALMEVDSETRAVSAKRLIQAPPHTHGALSRLMADEGVDLVIAGGIGQGARNILEQRNIKVLAGAPAETPENLVRAYLDGTLVLSAEHGDCGCGHHNHHHHHHHHGEK